MIRVKDLYKIYRIGENRVRALNGVDFNIEKGEFCCIVGTSGSGKSTLLNMLAGLEKPTKGEIVIAGEHIEKKSESQLVVFRQAHVGFIFQSYNLLPNMTALENVALPLTFQGVDKKTRLKRAAAMLKMVGLAKYIKHKPGQMSGGQQQRVGIARALVVNPEIIFADEPTGNLDSNTSLEVMQLIQKIVRKRNQTLVMVTHDNYLAGFGDKVIHIRDGKILKIDDNREHQQAVDPDGQNTEIESSESIGQNMEASWQPEDAAQDAADLQMQGTIEEQAAVQADIQAEETVS